MPTQPVKKHYTYTIKDFYKRFKEEFGDEISYKLYRRLMEAYFLKIHRKIIYDNHTYMMPYSLGSILVKAFKGNLRRKNPRAIDWQKTQKLGKVVRHLNRHTYGFYFGIVWDKSYVRFRNNAYYLFSASQSKKATRLGVGKKALSAHIKELANDPTKRSYIRI